MYVSTMLFTKTLPHNKTQIEDRGKKRSQDLSLHVYIFVIDTILEKNCYTIPMIITTKEK